MVADTLDLLHPMRDVHDRDTGSAQVADHTEQVFYFVRGQRGCRLVQNEDGDIPGQRAGDLDHLLFADRQRADRDVWVDPDAQALQNRHGLEAFGAAVHQQAFSLFGKEYVLGHRQVRAKAELLVDDADAVPRGVPDASQRHLASVDHQAATVKPLHTGEDAHQRGLACPVLADQHVHRACVNLEVHTGQRGHAAVALDDAPCGQSWRGHARPA